VIVSYGDQATEDFHKGIPSRHSRTIPDQIERVAQRVLDRLQAAVKLSDLKSPGLSLERLDDYPGMHAIRINRQYRVIFRFQAGNASEVQISKHYNR